MDGKAIIVDFDDTLFFTQKCKEAASIELLGKKISKQELRELKPKELKSKIYALADSKYNSLSRPNTKLIKILSKEKDSNAKIFILTARSTRSRKITIGLLKKYKVPFHKAIFREHHLIYTEDEEWKLGKINEFAGKYKNLVFYEDKKDNIAYFRNGIKTLSGSKFILVQEDGTHKEVL